MHLKKIKKLTSGKMFAILNYRVRIRIGFRFIVWVRIQVMDRVMVGILRLWCGSLHQYSGGVWAEIFCDQYPSLT